MAIAMEEKSTFQRTARKVEDMQRSSSVSSSLITYCTTKTISGNPVLDVLVKWQSAPDPSTSHNFASDRQHKGTSQWFMGDNKFGEWKVSGSLLWINGKRESVLLVMIPVISLTVWVS